MRMNHKKINIITGNGDVPHPKCISSPGMGMCLTQNAHLHREWGCASPGMHVLTGNAYLHQECTSFIQGTTVDFPPLFYAYVKVTDQNARMAVRILKYRPFRTNRQIARQNTVFSKMQEVNIGKLLKRSSKWMLVKIKKNVVDRKLWKMYLTKIHENLFLEIFLVNNR